MSESLLDFDTWPSQIASASIPANNNARRAEVLAGSPISATTTAQPGSPAERDIYILPAAATGSQWDNFDEGDVVIFYENTWTAYAPYDGLRKFVQDEGQDWQFVGDSSGGWAPAGGGGGGAVSSVNGQTGTVVLELGDLDDVDPSGWTDTYVLTWDNTAGLWKAAPGGGGGGGLTNWTEATTTLSGVTNSFTASNAGSNVNVAFIPKGSGAIQAAIQTNSSVGGNARGGNAVDWQTARSNADEVASGNAAVIVGGERNKVSNNYSVGGGYRLSLTGQYSFGFGDTNTSSSSYSAIWGTNNFSNASYTLVTGDGSSATGNNAWANGSLCVADASFAWAFGGRAVTRGIIGLRSWGSGRITSDGDSQADRLVARTSTSNATATAITSNNSSAATNNQYILAANSCANVMGNIVGREAATGDCASFTFTALVKQGSGAGTTSVVGQTVTPQFSNAGASTWLPTVVADTSNGGLTVNAVGQAAKNVKWTLDIYSAAYVAG